MENQNELVNVTLSILPNEQIEEGMQIMTEGFAKKMANKACIAAFLTSMCLGIAGSVMVDYITKKHKKEKED